MTLIFETLIFSNYQYARIQTISISPPINLSRLPFTQPCSQTVGLEGIEEKFGGHKFEKWFLN